MKYSLLVFIGAASYGILSTIAKLSYSAGFTASDATGSQMLFGTIILWAIVLFSKKDKASVSKKDTFNLMAKGLPIGLTSVFYYQSIQYLPASIAILLLFQFTWIGVLLDSVSTKKAPTKTTIISIVILMGGTMLASGILDTQFSGYDIKGIIYGLLASVSYAFFIFFNGKVKVKLSAAKQSALMLTGATILTSIIYPPVFLFNGAISNGLLFYGIPLAMFGAVIPPFLFAVGIPKVGISMSSIINSAELPVAVLASSLILHENVSPSQWVGVIIILSALIIPNIIKQKINKRKLALR